MKAKNVLERRTKGYEKTRNNQIGLYRQIQRVNIQEMFGDTGRSGNEYRRRGGGAIEET